MGSNEALKPSQRWIADRYASNARFVADLAEPLIDILDPQPDDLILDLGCGDGALTEKIAARAGGVIGVDSSENQVVAAHGRGVDVAVMDGHALSFDNVMDGVFSNAALHWMPRSELVIDGVWRALKPGGRFVGEMGGAGNIQSISGALVEAMIRRGLDGEAAFPWYFPTIADYRDQLTQRGFQVSSIDLISRPTPLPGDIADWFYTFAESFLLTVPSKERPGFVAEVRDALRPVLLDDDGVWIADYVRLRFVATKPLPTVC
jgi:trans-aconitate methyltransferase